MADLRTSAVALNAALLTLLWSGGSSCAPLDPLPILVQDPSPAALPRDVQELRDAWIECTAAAAMAEIRSGKPSDAVADAALRSCKAQERPLARALGTQLRQDGAGRVLDIVREGDRSNLIRALDGLKQRR